MRRTLPCLIFCLLLVAPAMLRAEADADSKQDGGYRSDDGVSLLLAGLVGTLALASQDEALRKLVMRNDSATLDAAAAVGDIGGHPLLVLGGGGLLWGAGQWSDNPQLATTGRLACTAVLGASASAALLKAGLGRERPGGEPDHFHPFTLDDEQHSFPSAHSTAVFALAAVLARRNPQPWVGWSAYTLATLVGVSRVIADEHWASDVAAGALLGELWGRWVVHSERATGVQLTASALPGGASIGLVLRW